MIDAPIGNESLPIRVSEVKGEIYSLFNGYTLTASIFGDSDDDSYDGCNNANEDSDDDSDENSDEEDTKLQTTDEHPFMVNVGAHVTLPLAAAKEVSIRFANTLYGYFIDGMDRVLETGHVLFA
nr:cytochrome P450 [Tanacetum cinerariifolium]